MCVLGVSFTMTPSSLIIKGASSCFPLMARAKRCKSLECTSCQFAGSNVTLQHRLSQFSLLHGQE